MDLDKKVKVTTKLDYMKDVITLLTSQILAQRLVDPIVRTFLNSNGKETFIPDASFSNDECIIINLLKLVSGVYDD